MSQDNSSLATDDLNKIKDAGNYSIFLQTLPIIVDYSFNRNKKEVLVKLQEFIKSFDASLTDAEKAEFKKEIDGFLQEFGQNLIDKLSTKYQPEQVRNILNQLTK